MMKTAAYLLLSCLAASASFGNPTSLRGLNTQDNKISLWLIDTDTNTLISELTENLVINLDQFNAIPSKLSIEAQVSDGMDSVRFEIADIPEAKRTEGSPPFALCGKTNGELRACELLNELNREYSLSATGFSEGMRLPKHSVVFTLTSGTVEPAVVTAVPDVPVISVAPTLPPASIAPPSGTGISILKLIYAPTNERVFDLYDGAKISLYALGIGSPDFNVQAIDPSGAVKHVKFSNGKVEAVEPFALCSDKKGDFDSCESFCADTGCDSLGIGMHHVSVRSFDESGRMGDLEMSFEIVEMESISTSVAPTTMPVILTKQPQIASPTKDPTVSPVLQTPGPFAAPSAPIGMATAAPSASSMDVPSELYSMQKGIWIEVDAYAPISARHEACFVLVGRKAYLVGGRGELNTDIYDPVERSWSQGAAPPIPLHHMQCVVADGLIWIMSAWTGSYPREESPDTAYAYDTTTDTWLEKTALPESRRRGGAAAVLVDRRIYISHGNTGGHEVSNHLTESHGWLDFYDIDTDEWTIGLADAPNPRDHTGGALVKGKICVAGGRNGGRLNWPTVGATDCFDLASGTWSVEADIPQERGGSSYGTTCDGRLIVAGGEGRGLAYNDVNVFDGSTWTSRFEISGMNRNRHGSSLAVDCLCNQIHVASGAETKGGRFEMTSLETFFVDGKDAQCTA